MKELHVHEITGHSLVPAKDIPALLNENHIEFQAIDCVNWKDYPYRPEVEFRIAHCKLEGLSLPSRSGIPHRSHGRCHFTELPRQGRKRTCRSSRRQRQSMGRLLL